MSRGKEKRDELLLNLLIAVCSLLTGLWVTVSFHQPGENSRSLKAGVRSVMNEK
jgi:hypothetical protein